MILKLDASSIGVRALLHGSICARRLAESPELPVLLVLPELLAQPEPLELPVLRAPQVLQVLLEQQVRQELQVLLVQ
jgi:hypothetical protein